MRVRGARVLGVNLVLVVVGASLVADHLGGAVVTGCRGGGHRRSGRSADGQPPRYHSGYEPHSAAATASDTAPSPHRTQSTFVVSPDEARNRPRQGRQLLSGHGRHQQPECDGIPAVADHHGEDGTQFLIGRMVHYNNPIQASDRYFVGDLNVRLGGFDGIRARLPWTLEETPNNPPAPKTRSWFQQRDRRSVALRKAERWTSAEDAPFLGVAQSSRGLVWRERLDPSLVNLATAISQQHGVPDVLGRVLAARGIDLGRRRDLSRPDAEGADAGPVEPHGHGQGRGAARRCDREARGGRRLRRLRRRRGVLVGAPRPLSGRARDRGAHLYSRSLARGLWARTCSPSSKLVAGGARLIVCVDCGTTSFEPLGGGRRPRRRNSS